MPTPRLAVLSIALLAIGIALTIASGGPPRLLGLALVFVGLAGLITLVLRLLDRGSRGG
ncbi:hypothetical protein [Microbacterium sp. NPDC055683]